LGAFASDTSASLPWLRASLFHGGKGVRQAAVEALPKTAQSVARIKEANLLNDPDAHVRLRTLLALSDMPQGTVPASGRLVMATAFKNLDRWSQYAFRIATSRVPIDTSASVPPTFLGAPIPVSRESGLKLYLDGTGRLNPESVKSLPDGTLRVYNLAGKLEARAEIRTGIQSVPLRLTRGAHRFTVRHFSGQITGWVLAGP
jgi:hypothetical protein